MCHRLACPQRTSSAFGLQARFRQEKLVVAGRTAEYVRIGNRGGRARFRVCPDCGSTVYRNHAGGDEFVAVTIGAFADPSFPPPIFSVYAERRHAWVSLPSSVVESWD
uniref:GFA family protein n=1 Tax=Acidiphilium TaxID=522 RepID=UPI0009DCFCF5